MQRLSTALILLLFTLFSTTVPASAAPKYLFKVGSLAPEGSIWATRFNAFVQEVTDRTGNEVGFRVYPGGVMGDDKAMFRKMRAGQLHGGGFTMTGIGEVVPDFRVLGIPYLFQSYAEVDAVIDGLLPTLRQRFADKGLELLAMSEVGFIYTMSTTPKVTLADLRSSKSWVPSDDPISPVFLKAMGVSPIPLSIPDVLASLQTGLVDTVYNSFYGAIVLQWFTRTPYVTDLPFGYAYGAFLLDRRAFAKLPAAHAQVVREAAATHFAALLQDTRRSNAEALEALKKNGVTILSANPASLVELPLLREATVQKVAGEAFSREVYDQTMALLNRFREKTDAGAPQP